MAGGNLGGMEVSLNIKSNIEAQISKDQKKVIDLSKNVDDLKSQLEKLNKTKGNNGDIKNTKEQLHNANQELKEMQSSFSKVETRANQLLNKANDIDNVIKSLKANSRNIQVFDDAALRGAREEIARIVRMMRSLSAGENSPLATGTLFRSGLGDITRSIGNVRKQVNSLISGSNKASAAEERDFAARVKAMQRERARAAAEQEKAETYYVTRKQRVDDAIQAMSKRQAELGKLQNNATAEDVRMLQAASRQADLLIQRLTDARTQYEAMQALKRQGKGDLTQTFLGRNTGMAELFGADPKRGWLAYNDVNSMIKDAIELTKRHSAELEKIQRAKDASQKSTDAETERTARLSRALEDVKRKIVDIRASMREAFQLHLNSSPLLTAFNRLNNLVKRGYTNNGAINSNAIKDESAFLKLLSDISTASAKAATDVKKYEDAKARAAQAASRSSNDQRALDATIERYAKLRSLLEEGLRVRNIGGSMGRDTQELTEKLRSLAQMVLQLRSAMQSGALATNLFNRGQAKVEIDDLQRLINLQAQLNKERNDTRPVKVQTAAGYDTAQIEKAISAHERLIALYNQMQALQRQMEPIRNVGAKRTEYWQLELQYNKVKAQFDALNSSKRNIDEIQRSLDALYQTLTKFLNAQQSARPILSENHSPADTALRQREAELARLQRQKDLEYAFRTQPAQAQNAALNEAKLRDVESTIERIKNRYQEISELANSRGNVLPDGLDARMSKIDELREKLRALSAEDKGQKGIVERMLKTENFGTLLKEVKDFFNQVKREARETDIFQDNTKRAQAEIRRLKNLLDSLISTKHKGISVGLDMSRLDSEIAYIQKKIHALQVSIKDGNFSSTKRWTLGEDSVERLSQIRRLIRAINSQIQETKQKTAQAAAETRAAAQAGREMASALERARSAARGTSGVLQDIKSLFLQGGIVFGARQFATSVIKTGGDIVQQHIAMQNIIGDLQEANELFAQTQQLALESPFTFQELNRDVKQLAAFGVESDRLYDTTKRIADISSGLGVSFSRLGLAYGQVKSRSWLDGKELRQFAYAGLPMLQKLTDYYNETGKNGQRGYTTSEVRNMISNREVSFEDVDAVFRRLTDEGGQFYQMQYVLSNTLLGQWNKLQDAWTIMLGKFADGKNLVGGVFMFFIKMTTQFIQAIDKLGPALVGLFAAPAVVGLRRSLGGGFGKALLGSKQQLASRYEQDALAGKKLTPMQKAIVANRNQINAADLKMLRTNNLLTANDLRRLYLSKAITREMYQQNLAAMGLKNRTGMIGASLTMIGGKLKGFGSSLLGFFGGPIGLGITAAMTAIGYLWSKWQEKQQAIKQMTDEIADKSKQASEFLGANDIKSVVSGGDSQEIDSMIANYKDKLKELAPYSYQAFFMTADEKQSHIERLEYLRNELELVRQAADEAKSYVPGFVGDNKRKFEDLQKDTQEYLNSVSKMNAYFESTEYVVNPSRLLKYAEASTGSLAESYNRLANAAQKVKDAESEINKFRAQRNEEKDYVRMYGNDSEQYARHAEKVKQASDSLNMATGKRIKALKEYREEIKNFRIEFGGQEIFGRNGSFKNAPIISLYDPLGTEVEDYIKTVNNKKRIDDVAKELFGSLEKQLGKNFWINHKLEYQQLLDSAFKDFGFSEDQAIVAKMAVSAQIKLKDAKFTDDETLLAVTESEVKKALENGKPFIENGVETTGKMVIDDLRYGKKLSPAREAYMKEAVEEAKRNVTLFFPGFRDQVNRLLDSMHLKALVSLAVDYNSVTDLQRELHALGDGAGQGVLDALETAGKGDPKDAAKTLGEQIETARANLKAQKAIVKQLERAGGIFPAGKNASAYSTALHNQTQYKDDVKNLKEAYYRLTGQHYKGNDEKNDDKERKKREEAQRKAEEKRRKEEEARRKAEQAYNRARSKEAQMLEKYNSTWEKWRNVEGEAAASRRVTGDKRFAGISKEYPDPSKLAENYQTLAAKILKKSGGDVKKMSDERRQQYQDLLAKAADKEAEAELEKVQRLNKAAQELLDKMSKRYDMYQKLAKVAGREVAAAYAFGGQSGQLGRYGSYYGYLRQRISSQTEAKSFNSVEGGNVTGNTYTGRNLPGVDVGAALKKGIDFSKLGPGATLQTALATTDEELKEKMGEKDFNLIKAYKNEIERLDQTIGESLVNGFTRFNDYASEIDALELKYGDMYGRLKERNDKQNEGKADYISDDALRRIVNVLNMLKAQETAQINYKSLQNSDDWIRFFNSSMLLATSDAKKFAKTIKDGLDAAFEAGAISADDYAAKIKEVNEKMGEVAENRSDLFTYMFDGGIDKMLQDRQQRGGQMIDTGSRLLNNANNDYLKAQAGGDAKGMEAAKNAAQQAQDMIKSGQDMQKGAKGAAQTMAIIDKIVNGINDNVQSLKALMDDIAGMIESTRGKDSADDFRTSTGYTFLSGFSKASQGATDAWNSLKSGNVMGVLEGGFRSFSGWITPWYERHDAKMDEIIKLADRANKNLENMQASVERTLQDTLGGVYAYTSKERDTKRIQEGLDNYSLAKSGKKYGSNTYGTSIGIGVGAGMVFGAIAGPIGAAIGAAIGGIIGALFGHGKKKYKTNYTDDTFEQMERAQKTGAYYDQMLASYMMQRDNTQAKLNAESKKKNKDKDKIQDLQNEVDKLDDKIATFAKDMAKNLYDIDVQSWAKSLSDAIVDAWASGEDAAEAYHDKVRELMKDLAKNIVAKKIMEIALQPTEDLIERLMKQKSGKLDENDIKLITDSLMDAEDTSINAITGVLDRLKAAGHDLSDANSSSMGSSIQGITEQTADLLASYVNAMRADLSVVRQMQSVFMPQMAAIAQSQLQQLGAVAANTLRNAEAAERIERSVNNVSDILTASRNESRPLSVKVK